MGNEVYKLNNWPFAKGEQAQPISIKAVVKLTSYGGTILRVNEVKNKEIPFDVISFSHPELSKYEKSNEPKKYTMRELKSSTEEREKIIDEMVEGTTEDFELIEMNKQVHKYTESPSIVKVQGKSTKQRTYEDESTKRYTFKDSGILSTLDTGGNRLARGIENQSLQQVQAEGEFVYVLQELEDYKEVQFINLQLSSLLMGDGNQLIDGLLLNLVNSSGTWERDVLGDLERKNVVIQKAKHSKKDYKHRAKLLANKML